MVQVVVLEDRPAHREELMGLLEQWTLADQLEIECAAAPDELRELVRRTPVDILLTDIDLGEGAKAAEFSWCRNYSRPKAALRSST